MLACFTTETFEGSVDCAGVVEEDELLSVSMLGLG